MKPAESIASFPPASPARGSLLLSRKGVSWWLLCVLLTGIVIGQVHPHAGIAYLYYLAAWTAVMVIFDRRMVFAFVSAYLVSALLAAFYILLQVHFYPDSYGCTSPLGAQTDDSFFFSLVADSVPPGMETRPGYYFYSYGFSSLVRWVTPFEVYHPLDVIFFLSGVAGMVCVYTRQLTVLVTGNWKAGNTAYALSLFCPVMLMNGGAVFVRDTFVAALFILSLCCVFRRRYLAFFITIVFQFVLRPGTALMILVLYGVMFGESLVASFWASRRKLVAYLALGIFAGLALAFVGYQQQDWLARQLERNGVDLGDLKRVGQEEIIADGGGKGAFTAIQNQSLPVRVVLSTVYMYLAPFFSLNQLRTPDGFDTRILLINVVYPVWALFIHAWIFSAVIGKGRMHQRLRRWAVFLAVACFLIGVFSLQTRHRVIVQPVFYVLAAAGRQFGSANVKMVGFGLSACWLALQLLYFFLS